MLLLIGIAILIIASYVLVKILDWRSQDKNNDTYDKRKGGK